MTKTKTISPAGSTDAKSRAACTSRAANLPRRQVLAAGALAAAGFAARLPAAEVSDGSGIARNAESIHLEPGFAASRARVYAALTDAKQFDQVVQLSGVMKSIDAKVPTTLSAVEGSAFALFGGYISGRQILLQHDELIVQAWRSASWGPGLYSIARFQVVEAAAGSKIIFDHGGFPNNEARSLAAGWQANYWTPLRKLLAR
jgi:activator of HSP90 ATPase